MSPRPERLAARPDIEPSLAADKIISIFRVEWGLLLEFKRVLVQKAYEQGRILHPSDLSDEAVFSLLESSVDVRVLATNEIRERGYLPVRPRAGEAQPEGVPAPSENQGATPRTLTPREQNELRARRQAEAQKRTQPPASTPALPTFPQIAPEQLPSLLRSSNVDLGSRTAQQPMNRASQGAGAGAVGAAALAAGMGMNSSENLPEDLPQPPRQAPRFPSLEEEPNGASTVAPDLYPGPTVSSRRQPYANIPALYDLYSQVTPAAQPLRRFGEDIFSNGSGNPDEIPMDLPAGPDYVIGPGDALTINLWGSVSSRLQRVVDREGRVALPESGPLQVAGQSLAQVQAAIRKHLAMQYHDVSADVSLVRLRSVRVYVVGDVQRPGPYDISALSTPLNAVYAAGGPTSRGSVRNIRHLRGKELLQDVDAYELILNGVRGEMRHMESGDTILVPPAGAQVTLEGMVRRPAIYELRGEKSLQDALALAGGVLPTGTMRHIVVQRLMAHEKRVMVNVDLPEGTPPSDVASRLADFKIEDGDQVSVSPILPSSQQTVYLDGHVFRPGKYGYRDGMKLSELLRSYAEILPEPYKKHAEIIRLQKPDYRPMVMSFNLGEVQGGTEDIALQAFDTVRIFGRYDFEDPPVITVSGEVREPGVRRTNGETYLRDAVYLAGGLTPDASVDEAIVFRRQAGEVKVFSVKLGHAMQGDLGSNILLQGNDRLIIHRSLAKVDPPTVTVQGEVVNPGKYALGAGMTVSNLVRAAGGLRRSAYTERADLSRYLARDAQGIDGQHQEVEIGKVLQGDLAADVQLQQGDVLTIRQITGWSDIGSAIGVQGEVVHPGTYGIGQGERLSSVLRRAGGFRDGAYPQGAVLVRDQVRELDVKSREALIRRIESAQPQVNGDNAAAIASAFAQQQQQILARLRSAPASGRLVVKISADMSKWENTVSDLEVRAGDSLFIPKRPGFVMVSGQANSPTALTFVPGKRAGWYLQRAGGGTEFANMKAAFIVRADGSVVGGKSGGFWRADVLGTAMHPGDTLVVPEKLIGDTIWKSLLNTAQIASSLAIAASVITQ